MAVFVFVFVFFVDFFFYAQAKRARGAREPGEREEPGEPGEREEGVVVEASSMVGFVCFLGPIDPSVAYPVHTYMHTCIHADGMYDRVLDVFLNARKALYYSLSCHPVSRPACRPTDRPRSPRLAGR